MEYKGKEYQARLVEIPGWGERVVSVESLEKELLPDGARYADEEARWVDEQIFFYVPDEEIDRGDLGEYVARIC